MTAKTTIPLTPELTLNEIASVVPDAIEVFHKYQLDACCGGAKPLGLVCERHGLDLEQVMTELRAKADAN